MNKSSKKQVNSNFFSIKDLFFVGTELYHKIEKFGKIELKKLEKSFVKNDLGRDFSLIDRYHEFINEPNHINYNQCVNYKDYKFYNLYEPFAHEPKIGECPHSIALLEHIFGEQYELGLDYLKLLLEQPKQMLPILSLVSKERETGKTTFLNWLKEIFGLNMTINRSMDFESNFNSDWVHKLIIAIDETFLEKKATSEMIKNISTAKTLKMEGKGKDRTDVEFFGKLVLCSNNVENFVKIDKEENRYWVRQVSKFTNYVANLEQKLAEEIPAFLYFLQQRGLKTQKESRTWFSSQQIWTPALEVLVEGNRSSIEKEIETIIADSFDDYEVDTICYTEKDIIDKLKEINIRVNKFQVAKIIKEIWKISPRTKASTYKYYFSAQTINQDFFVNSETRQGKFFTFLKPTINQTGTEQAQETITEQLNTINIAKNEVQLVDNQVYAVDFSKNHVETPF